MTRIPGVAKQHPPDTFSVLVYAGAALAFVGQEVTSRMDLSAKRHARMAVQRPWLSFMRGVLLTGLDWWSWSPPRCGQGCCPAGAGSSS
jgi:hypothetical protein